MTQLITYALIPALMICAGCDPGPLPATPAASAAQAADSAPDHDEEASAPSTKYAPSTTEERMAFLDLGAQPSDEIIATYKAALHRLSKQYVGTPAEIGDVISKIQGVLRQDCGSTVSMLQIMRDMDAPKAATLQVPIKEAAALYIMMASQNSATGCKKAP